MSDEQIIKLATEIMGKCGDLWYYRKVDSIDMAIEIIKEHMNKIKGQDIPKKETDREREVRESIEEQEDSERHSD